MKRLKLRLSSHAPAVKIPGWMTGGGLPASASPELPPPPPDPPAPGVVPPPVVLVLAPPERNNLRKRRADSAGVQRKTDVLQRDIGAGRPRMDMAWVCSATARNETSPSRPSPKENGPRK